MCLHEGACAATHSLVNALGPGQGRDETAVLAGPVT